MAPQTLKSGVAADLENGLSKKAAFGKELGGGALGDMFGRSEGKSIGGSILVAAVDNTTLAQIGDGAKVRIGQAGRSSSPDETILRIDVAQAGALSSGDSSGKAFAGSAVGYRQRSTTVAGLTAGPLGVTVSGGGTVSHRGDTGAANRGRPAQPRRPTSKQSPTRHRRFHRQIERRQGTGRFGRGQRHPAPD